jgi:hypothetical protein
MGMHERKKIDWIMKMWARISVILILTIFCLSLFLVLVMAAFLQFNNAVLILFYFFTFLLFIFFETPMIYYGWLQNVVYKMFFKIYSKILTLLILLFVIYSTYVNVYYKVNIDEYLLTIGISIIIILPLFYFAWRKEPDSIKKSLNKINNKLERI